ncbi:Signal transduction histidine-protein kinase BaeS [Actinomadura rubteroloni]|uniref:histidine kinase n=1 Tax=Actinomadura rubteroloni TaxID=1926885 RepID=A0A2P4UN63_9ACTN|nr:HAMP domain-containing sensor histidine kinase [Actinomadura rubteroloni]POM26449.1 Signal transduction histidine-protein kinase BaeS [Actinomadura rubteroloni]
MRLHERLLASGLPFRTVRMRLTALYCSLFTISSGLLLVITYVLMRRTKWVLIVYDDSGPWRREQMEQLRRAQLRQLLLQFGIAFAIMVVISIALGWVVAGRVLRPLRTMTATVQRISARNVHERLAVTGPRDELKDLADTVDGLLGRLETALNAHKRFVANAAHELRTPLTLERALLEETLTDRAATPDTYRAMSERLLSLSKDQAQLLEALLTLTSSERGLNRREPFDLSDLARQALDTARLEADARGVRINARIASAPSTGDPALAGRLVANLVDNAVHHNVPGGHVEIVTELRGGRAFVGVANSGPLISPHQVAGLFEPFQRLAGRTARADGHHGLGLSIVRAIATAHGASITARARPDGGLAIEIAFPASRVPVHA